MSKTPFVTKEQIEEIVKTGAASIKIVKPHADNKEVFRNLVPKRFCSL